MSISSAQRVRLGIFMVCGIVIMFLFIAIPVGLRLRDHTVMYYALFSGESLSGLEQGASVKFRGIPIGKVVKVGYDPKNLSSIKATLKIDDVFPMKQDMYAQSGMMGITGLMYIDILGGSDTGIALKPGSNITTRRSVIASITGKAEALSVKIELLLNHLNQLTDPDSLHALREILDNAAVISADARSFFDNVRPEISSMSRSTQNVLRSVDSISTDIRMLTSELRKNVSSGQITRIMSSVDSTAHSLKELSETFNMTLKQSREDISSTMKNIREASANANELTRELSENPTLLLRGEQQKERVVR